ncbi:MAG: glycosyltransferase [Xanthomonadales bacterium]|nr:glycosyltransferase [Xanthomonadales bacterium]
MSAESNRPLRVLHVISSLSPALGGPSAALPMFERCLEARGITVTTVTTDDDGPGRRLHHPPTRTPHGNARVYLPRTLHAYHYCASFADWLTVHAAQHDLLHIHGAFSHVPMTAARIAHRLGVPYIVRPCGILSAYGMGRSRFVKSLSLRYVEVPALRNAAAIHVTSAIERTDIEALVSGPLRFAEIPLGIEGPPPGNAGRWLARYPLLQAAGRRLLFLSRIDPKKNLEALIDALALLPPDLALCVCGDGDAEYRRQLEGRARTAGVDARVVWAGHVSGQDKADALAAADLFVLPSFAENFGIAAVEALLAGRPCVLGEGVGIAGTIATAGAGCSVAPTAAAVAAAVDALNLTTLQQMSTAARRLAAERYSPEAMGAALESLYRRLLDR